MQNILGRDCFFADTALGECDIFSNSRIEVMGDHHHIEGLIKRVYSVWPRWSRRRWNDVWLAAHFEDVRGVPASRPFRVKRVNRSSLEGCDCILDETALVQRIGVDENLHIHVIRNREAAIDGGGCRTPVFMKLEAACPGLDLVNETPCRARVALSEEAEIPWVGLGGLVPPFDMPRTLGAGGVLAPLPRSFASP